MELIINYSHEDNIINTLYILKEHNIPYELRNETRKCLVILEPEMLSGLAVDISEC